MVIFLIPAHKLFHRSLVYTILSTVQFSLTNRPCRNQSNVWCIKFCSKYSSNTVLCLLRNLMHQTYIICFECTFWKLYNCIVVQGEDMECSYSCKGVSVTVLSSICELFFTIRTSKLKCKVICASCYVRLSFFKLVANFCHSTMIALTTLQYIQILYFLKLFHNLDTGSFRGCK